jgi:hypothetical protein
VTFDQPPTIAVGPVSPAHGYSVREATQNSRTRSDTPSSAIMIEWRFILGRGQREAARRIWQAMSFAYGGLRGLNVSAVFFESAPFASLVLAYLV